MLPWAFPPNWRSAWASSTTARGRRRRWQAWQSGAGAIKKKATWLEITTAGGATAVVLPADAELLVPYLTQVVVTSTTGLLFPPTGHKINAAAANASVNLVQFLPRITMRISATQWLSLLAA